MKKKMFTSLATWLFLVGMVGLANATPVIFDLGGDLGLADPSGILFSDDSSGLTVTATADGFTGENTTQRRVQQTSAGLGVWLSSNTDYDQQIDNGGTLDRLFLDFSEQITLLGATFTEIYKGSTFSLTTPGTSLTSQIASSSFDFTSLSIFANTFTITAGNGSDIFGSANSKFRLSSVTVDLFTAETVDLFTIETQDTPLPSVPEPATMLLFGTGLVGLAGVRLRSKK